MSATWVYFIQSGDDGPVKIGAAKDPDERLATLQIGNPEKLRGLTAVWAPPDFEREVHRRFASVRLRGEWFRPDPELLEFVEGVDYVCGPFWFREDMLPEMEALVFGG